MVRRWSYLNGFNSSTFDLNRKRMWNLLPVYRAALFKATTYYNQPLFYDELTKLSRRSFFRIRHISNLLIYQNLLTDWAREYAWIRRVYRSLLSFRVYKYNYLMGLSTIYFYKTEKNFTPLRAFSVSNFSSSYVQHCLKFNRVKFEFFTQYPHFLTSFASSFLPLTSNTILTKGSDDLLYTLTGPTLSNPLSSDSIELVYRSIQIRIYSTLISSLVELYKILILLTLKSL